MNDMYEIFMDIKGYEGKYQVSNLGNVRNSKGKVMKQRKDEFGYMKINLTKDGKQKTHKVHRLVLETFKANSENKPQINHINEDKTDNRLNNLEWCTAKYNANYGSRNERMVATCKKNGTYEKLASTKKANGTYDKISDKCSKPIYCITNNTVYKSSNEAARKLNLEQSSITKCLKGKYKSTGGYQFKYYTEGDLL